MYPCKAKSMNFFLLFHFVLPQVSAALQKYFESINRPPNLYPEHMQPFSWETWFTLCKELKVFLDENIRQRSFDKSLDITPIKTALLQFFFPGSLTLTYHYNRFPPGVMVQNLRFGSLMLDDKSENDLDLSDLSTMPELYNTMFIERNEDSLYPSSFICLSFANDEDRSTENRQGIISSIKDTQEGWLVSLKGLNIVEHHESVLDRCIIQARDKVSPLLKNNLNRNLTGQSSTLINIDSLRKDVALGISFMTRNMSSFHPRVFVPSIHRYIYSVLTYIFKNKAMKDASRFDSPGVQKTVFKQSLASHWNALIPESKIKFLEDEKLGVKKGRSLMKLVFKFIQPGTKFEIGNKEFCFQDHYCMFDSAEIDREGKFRRIFIYPEQGYILLVPKGIRNSESIPITHDDILTI